MSSDVFGNLNVFAKSFISAAFALPSAGGDDTRAKRHVLPSGRTPNPPSMSFEDFGVTRTVRRTPSSVRATGLSEPVGKPGQNVLKEE